MNPCVLVYDYGAFEEYIQNADLDDFDKKWYLEWRCLDLAISPMEDDIRRYLRKGHYYGYVCGKN